MLIKKRRLLVRSTPGTDRLDQFCVGSKIIDSGSDPKPSPSASVGESSSEPSSAKGCRKTGIMIMDGLETSLSAASFADAQAHFNLLSFDAFKSEMPVDEDADSLAASSPHDTSHNLIDDSLNTPNLLDGPAIFFAPSVVLPPPVLSTGKQQQQQHHKWMTSSFLPPADVIGRQNSNIPRLRLSLLMTNVSYSVAHGLGKTLPSGPFDVIVFPTCFHRPFSCLIQFTCRRFSGKFIRIFPAFFSFCFIDPFQND